MPSENNVQILKESKARFEGVIFKQTADLGTNKETSCKVINEATGEVIAQSGGGGGENNFVSYTLEITVTETSAQDPPLMSGPIINQDGTIGNYVPLSATGTNNINVVSTTLENGAATLTFITSGTLELTTTTEDAVAINENKVYVFGDNGKLSVGVK